MFSTVRYAENWEPTMKDFDGCNINGVPMCECWKGFTPKFQAKFDLSDWSSSCVLCKENEVKLSQYLIILIEICVLYLFSSFWNEVFQVLFVAQTH